MSSSDGTWSLHDYSKKAKLLQIQEESSVTALEFHPDGLIMAVGLSNGQVNVYDLRTMNLAKTLEAASESPVRQIAFSNKGIFMAVSW